MAFFHGFVDNNLETDLSSKGTHKCLHLQMVSKGCKGNHSLVNMVTCASSVVENSLMSNTACAHVSV